jgi:putative ABC transport system permease protein
MKTVINKLLFSFRFAFKNIIRFKVRSILIVLSFFALFVSLLLGLSVNDFLYTYYYDELEDQYRTIDFSMKTNLNSNLRYFSITHLQQNTELNGYIETYYPFFEIETIVEIDASNKTYVKTMSSTIEHLIPVSNLDENTSIALTDTQVVITKSFSEKYSLNLNDSFMMYIGSAQRDLQIIEIVEDGGLFQGDTVFINKSSSISLFLTAMNPSLGTLPPSLLVNIYNRVYFNVAQGVSVDEAMNFVQSITAYESYDIAEVIQTNEINTRIRQNTVILELVLFIVIAAILLVMHTTFLLYYDEKKKTFAVIGLLGGQSAFSLRIVLIELLIFYIIAFIPSIFIANLVFIKGLTYLGSTSNYTINIQSVIITACLTTVIYVMSTLYYLHKFNKASNITQSSDLGAEKRYPMKTLTYSLILSALLYGLLYLSLINKPLGNMLPVIKTLVSLILLFILSFFLIGLVILIFKNNSKFTRFYLHLKTLVSKNAFPQYISVMMVCFISIFMIVQANDYMKERIEIFDREYRIDYVLTNFISRYDSTYNDVQNIENVETVTKVGYYQNVDFGHEIDKIISVISIDSQEISTYFSLDISQDDLSKLSQSDELIILLPQKYNEIYKIHIGDQIYLTFSPTKENIPFIVGGFFEKQLSNQAFINMHLVDEYKDSTYNAMFINSITDDSTLKTELIDRYGQNMVYIIDFNEIISSRIFEMAQTTSYITMILSAIVLCFILAIINHSFLLLNQMENTYAKLYVVGLSIKGIQKLIIKESLIVFTLLLLVSIFGYILIASQLRGLFILLGQYENVGLYGSSIWFGSMLLLIVYILTKLIYLLGINRVNPSKILKYH